MLKMTEYGVVPIMAGWEDALPPWLERSARATPPKQVDVDVELRAVVGQAVLDPVVGRAAEVFRFEGKLLAGESSALASAAAGYLGPTFRIRRGQRLRVRFTNGLPEPSIVHWHGLHLSQENDGHPRLVVPPGGSYVYEFTVEDRPGTYWYHPHPHNRTGVQVYRGLAGVFLVIDPDDASRGLPPAEQDLPLVLQERILDASGQLVYSPNSMLGLLGDRTFVNGLASAPVAVTEGSYRLRLVNGSNARIYKLAWSDGSPLTVIGTDGGLLASPLKRPYVMIAPAQRIDLWADFGRSPRGQDVWLESTAYSTGSGMGMMGGGMGGGGMGMMGGGGMGMGPGMCGGGMGMGPGMMGAVAGPPNGTPFRVCRFVVRGKGKRLPPPQALLPIPFRPQDEVSNLSAPRSIQLSMMHMQWLLNGRSFGMTEVAADERVKIDTTEDWEFHNLGGMMALPHPMHLHGGQFQVVARSSTQGFKAHADSVREGLLDEGLRDTVLVMPGESVRIRMRFDRHPGLFLYHCHTLEHQDMGMMRNYLVEA